MKAGRGYALPQARPRATYRLQFYSGFRFRDAMPVVSYLAALGISHCYASPYLKAHTGSVHGYDIADHSVLNPEVGTEAERTAFVQALTSQGMGQILDVVPNHMRVDDPNNRWWWDVLERGRRSRFAHYFDIDWETPERPYEDKVVVPILGGLYGEVLESGEIRLDFEADAGRFVIRYYDHVLPIGPQSYPRLLAEVARAVAGLGSEAESLWQEISALIAGFEQVVGEAQEARDEMAWRAEMQRRWATWIATCAECQQALARVLDSYNSGEDAGRHRFDALHELLEEQHYRLTFWRVAGYEINYRRFFDVSELAALRMEDPEVFAATHALIGQWIAAGAVEGLRIDHPDGLRDPKAYCERLQEWVTGLGPRGGRDSGRAGPIYLVLEKILAATETLPGDWRCDGTTGYDFMRLVTGLLVDPEGAAGIDAAYGGFVDGPDDYARMLYECKGLVMHTSLGSEIYALGLALDRIAERDRRTRDFTLSAQRTALFEIVACFPVYRTYVTEGHVSADDRRWIDAACEAAQTRNPLVEPGVVAFIRDQLLLNDWAQRDAEERAAVLEFVAAFQQYTAPVMAKGLEDTLFYRYNRFVALNEVGGDPSRFGVSAESFHAANVERLARWPGSLLATATHDTKRSEDMRARLAVLAEIPAQWARQAQKLKAQNAHLKSVAGPGAPTGRDEYLFYQSLVGIWPLRDREPVWDDLRRRLKDYMLKAVREAKAETSWVRPDTDYEAAMLRFVEGVMDPVRNGAGLEALAAFIKPLARVGLFNGLSQTVLKLTAPGVPDFYQGSELWDFSLVDPDNRRPVDYALRYGALADVARFDDLPAPARAPFLADRLAQIEDGRIKMHIIRCLLRARRDHGPLFEEGTYRPLAFRGAGSRHLVGFMRIWRDEVLVVIVPRYYWALSRGGTRLPLGPEVWHDTVLGTPPEWPLRGAYNVLTGASWSPRAAADPAVADLLGPFPVAVWHGLRRQDLRPDSVLG